MTILEAITKIDALKPNTYTQHEKVAWLSTVEGMIYRNVIDTHLRNNGESEIVFNGYDDNTPVDTEMIVYPPYDELYLLWLESMMDYTNGEYAKYNNVVTRFNDINQAYTNDYNRTHMPKGSGSKYW